MKMDVNIIESLIVLSIIPSAFMIDFDITHIKWKGSERSNGESTNETVIASYDCDLNSIFLLVESFQSTIRNGMHCTGKTVTNESLSLNVTYTDGAQSAIQLFNLKTYLFKTDGKELFYQYGLIDNKLCGLGKFYAHHIILQDHKDKCNSAKGLTNTKTTMAFIEITSKKCRSKCKGVKNTIYEPGLKYRKIKIIA